MAKQVVVTIGRQFGSGGTRLEIFWRRDLIFRCMTIIL